MVKRLIRYDKAQIIPDKREISATTDNVNVCANSHFKQTHDVGDSCIVACCVPISYLLAEQLAFLVDKNC